MSKSKMVMLPRSVVEHVMHHLNRGDDDAVCWADGVIKPALERPQGKLTAHDIADSALLGNIESPFNACMHQEHCKRWKKEAERHHRQDPQFDAISVEQERLAVQFCAEIAGPCGGKSSLPDPVRLLEMAEALYRAEVGCGAAQPPVVEQPEQQSVAWANKAMKLATDFAIESLRVGSHEKKDSILNNGVYTFETTMLRDKREAARERLRKHLYTRPQPQSDATPYLYYDPENGDTWTQEAIDEGFCVADNLIPLYTK